MSDAFNEKQACVVSFINQCQTIVEAIYKGHASEKYSLVLPGEYERSERDRSNARRIKSPFRGKIKSISSERRYFDIPNEMGGIEIDESSLGRMLGGRLQECVNYLDRICARVKDGTSKILVTGDVNSGKSTLINAFLRREILPIDQQPCTQSFCEVIPSVPSYDQEVVHAIPNYEAYASNNGGTYDLLGMEAMTDLIQDERTPYQLFRVFVQNRSLSFASEANINISIIDSPGLNSDLFKTMSLFAKQEDIDVIIFVINAANHLTLSAREFLESAGREKSYVFIVVNKFDEIRNQEKCKRQVLSQIKEVLPKTFESPHDLIHFVSALEFMRASALPPASLVSSMANQIEFSEIAGRRFDSKEVCSGFETLETSLKQFIFEKRTTSKLLPALTFLQNILVELEELIEYNFVRRREELSMIENELAIIVPCFEELAAHNGLLQADLSKALEDSVKSVYLEAQRSLSDWNVYVYTVEKAPWCGLLGISRFLRKTHEEVVAEATKFLRGTCDSTVMKVQAGEDLLSMVASSHLKQKLRFDPFNSSGQIIKLPDPTIPTFSIFTFSEFPRIITNSTWIRATALASAFFGYQPLLNLTIRMMDLSKSSGRVLSFSLIFFTGAFGAYVLYRDLEGLVRSRLVSHYSQYFRSNEWLIEPARSVEGIGRASLLKKSSSIISSFEEALHQQRQICAEKNLTRCRIQSILGAMDENLKSIRSLLISVNDFKL